MNRTNLLIQMAPIPATFEGTPAQLGAEMVRRMQIVSPSGTNFIYVGDNEPTSNVGPWLKDGNKWYVWDDEVKRYVALDISDSETRWFHMGASTPSNSTPPVWLRTTQDYTVASPSYGGPIGWYIWNGSVWAPYSGIVMSGPTINRPASPVNFQQYYDTDISVFIWYERGMWRTVDGCPGDIKHVNFDTLEESLLRNPGWQLFGTNNQSIRGRYISQATKDTTASGGTTNLTVDTGVSHPREAREVWGTTDAVSLGGHTHGGAVAPDASPVSYPPTISLWTLEKL